MGYSKGALSENLNSSEVIWLQHVVLKNQDCLPKVTERAVEVWDKTCWITASISTVVSEEVKDGLVQIDGSKGHIAAAQGSEVLFCFCINFCSLQQTEMSWPLARQNSQRVPLEDRGGTPRVYSWRSSECSNGRLCRCCSQYMIRWWHVMSRSTVFLRNELLDHSTKRRVGNRLSREALVGSKSSRKPIMKCINLRRSRYFTKSSMSLEHTSGGSIAKSCSHIVEVWE